MTQGKEGASKDGAQTVRWDRARQQDVSSTLAIARAVKDQVALDFGELARSEGVELSPRLQRRILLRPAAAKSLLDMLTRLTAESGVSADSAS